MKILMGAQNISLRRALDVNNAIDHCFKGEQPKSKWKKHLVQIAATICLWMTTVNVAFILMGCLQERDQISSIRDDWCTSEHTKRQIIDVY